MKSRTPAIVAFATLLIAVNFGHARSQLPEPPSPDVAPIEHPDEPGTGRLVAGGLMGGLVGPGLGLFGGAMIEHTATTSCTDFCGLAGSLLGGVALESVGLGLGVHLHDDRRDNPVLTSLVSLVTAAASLYAIEQINERRLRGPVENGGTRGRCH